MAAGDLDIRPLTGALGAEVGGIDLSRELAPETTAKIRKALARRLVLVFPDQSLTPEQLEAFTASLGPLGQAPFIRPLDDHPEIIAVLKEADERNIHVFGGRWHSDYSFLEEPPLGTVLYAIEVPTHGGDTMFTNMHLAFETLSQGMRKLLSSLHAVHQGTLYGTKALPASARTPRSIEIARNDPEADVERVHPVVRTHPETKRKALYVNPVYTTRLENMTQAESRPLLDFLHTHATRPDFTCRVRWRKGSLALWDNRATMHYAVNDYDGQRRLMHRTTITGDKPY